MQRSCEHGGGNVATVSWDGLGVDRLVGVRAVSSCGMRLVSAAVWAPHSEWQLCPSDQIPPSVISVHMIFSPWTVPHGPPHRVHHCGKERGPHTRDRLRPRRSGSLAPTSSWHSPCASEGTLDVETMTLTFSTKNDVRWESRKCAQFGEILAKTVLQKLFSLMLPG